MNFKYILYIKIEQTQQQININKLKLINEKQTGVLRMTKINKNLVQKQKTFRTRYLQIIIMLSSKHSYHNCSYSSEFIIFTMTEVKISSIWYI